MAITKSMNLREIVEKYPESAGIIFGEGLHCIGCHAAAFETLEQGCRAHGMAEEDIDALIKKLNDAVKNKKGGKNRVHD